MELSLLAFSIILSIVTWKLLWQPSILDHTRDKLFNLREEVRAQFLADGYGTAHPLYRKLRDLLNGHLRYTEEATFVRMILSMRSLAANPLLANELSKSFRRSFRTDDRALEAYVQSVLNRAAIISMNHAVLQSALAMLIVSAVLVAKALRAFLTWAQSKSKNANPMRHVRVAALAAACTTAFPAAMVSVLAQIGIGRTIAQTAMNEAALHT